MGKHGTMLSGPSKRFEIVFEAFNGQCYLIPLVRGPLWPDDDDPPAHVMERTDGVLETLKGNFGSIDQLAPFFGCIVDYDSIKPIDGN